MRLFTAIKRFILWDYPRASWQYDVMVGLILAFVFLTPREWFRDQPRLPLASRIAKLQSAHGTDVYWIDAAVLESVPEDARSKRTAELLRQQTGTRIQAVRLEKVHDSEAELKGYLAFTLP